MSIGEKKKSGRRSTLRKDFARRRTSDRWRAGVGRLHRAPWLRHRQRKGERADVVDSDAAAERRWKERGEPCGESESVAAGAADEASPWAERNGSCNHHRRESGSPRRSSPWCRTRAVYSRGANRSYSIHGGDDRKPPPRFLVRSRRLSSDVSAASGSDDCGTGGGRTGVEANWVKAGASPPQRPRWVVPVIAWWAETSNSWYPKCASAEDLISFAVRA